MERMTQIRIETLANNLRESCASTEYGIADPVASLEKLGYRVVRFPVGEKGPLGFAQLRDDDKVIFSNSSQILSRELFTIAHELGHHVLNHLTDGLSMIADSTMSGADEQEIEANYFAACFLVPEQKLLYFLKKELKDRKEKDWTALDVARMQTAFDVSFDMILNRLSRLHLITPETYERLKTAKFETSVSNMLRMIDGSDALCRPSYAKRIPTEFLQWVTENYQRKLIPQATLEKALSPFNISVETMLPDEEPEEEEDIDALLEELDG